MKKIFFILFFGLALPVYAASENDGLYRDLAQFSQIIQIVQTQYVEQPDSQQMIRGAIEGLLATLDPHSLYFSKSEFQEFKNETKGEFGGVGLEVAQKNGELVVVAPIEGTPAWDAHIESGDKILAINQMITEKLSLESAVSLMRGETGKKIHLTLMHQGKVRQVVLTHQVVKLKAVRLRLEANVVVARISSFTEGVAHEFKSALESFLAEHTNVTGLVLDLRDNPGGLVNEATRMADLFLRQGKIVSTKGLHVPAQTVNAKAFGTVFADLPVAVLVNGGSASASEILAGALRDQKRAKIYGTTTYGKGSVQSLIPLINGAGLKLTVAHYFTPSGQKIDGVGLKPDVNLGKKQFNKWWLSSHKSEPTREDYFKYQLEQTRLGF